MIVLLILNFKGKEILHLENYDIDYANKVKNTLIFNAFVFSQVSLFTQIKRDKMDCLVFGSLEYVHTA